MAERFVHLETALRSLGAGIEYPETPPIESEVITRLGAERLRRHRPILPQLALWPRRRIAVAIAIAVLALLAIAAGVTRLTIGAVRIQVRPTPSSSITSSPPPLSNSDVLGPPLSLEQARAELDFPIAVPAGPAPDEAYVFRTFFDRNGLVLAWGASERYPAIGGTPWGLALMELTGDDEVIVKNVLSFDDVIEAEVDGRRAFWLPDPHPLEIRTLRGTVHLTAQGHVLVWQVGRVTYRLETSLGLEKAVALAESVR